jgi:hypothetical protein
MYELEVLAKVQFDKDISNRSLHRQVHSKYTLQICRLLAQDCRV